MPPGVGRGPWPCGRGAPPGPPCGRGAPGAPGAPGRGAPPGRGACGRAMPVEPPEVKGLLPGRGPAGRPPGRGARSPGAPGRGPPGRPPSRWPAGPGRAPGRGPGVAPGRGAAGRSWAGRSCEGAAGAGAENSAAGTGVTGAGFAGAAGPGLGPGRGPGAGAPPAGLGVVGAAAGLGAGAAGFGAPGVGAPGFAAALRGAAGFAEGLPAPPPGPCSASVSLRTTGASIVEDAERTNSPSSWSLAMTTLLSTPNSLASSYTRTLATSLLLGPGCPPDRRYFMGVLIAYSSSAHRNLDLLPTREVPDRTVARAVLLTVLPAGAAGRSAGPFDVPAQFRGVERPGGFERPRERPAAHRQIEADRCGMHGCTPAGQRTARIGNDDALDHHGPQQLALGRSLPAPHTGALRACAGMRPARHA